MEANKSEVPTYIIIIRFGETGRSLACYETKKKTLDFSYNRLSDFLKLATCEIELSKLPSELLQHDWLAPLPYILEDDLESQSSRTRKDVTFQRALFCIILEDTKFKLQCAVILKTHLPDSVDKTKIDAEKKHVFDVINNVYLELAQQRTFVTLKNAVSKFIDLEEYRFNLAVSVQQNKETRRKFARQIRVQRRRYKLQLFDINARIERQRTALSDAKIMIEVKSRYTDYWEESRAEQLKINISNKESKRQSSIAQYNEKCGQEQRVHNEVNLFIQIAIDETLSKIEYWMNKYDEDLEKIEMQVQLKMKEFLDMRDKRMEMEELITKRDKEMIDWMSFKEGREKDRLYREMMTNAAFAIQAWWRGLLVRLELGPYKPKIEKRKRKTKSQDKKLK